jgi:DNA-binding PadR family transcriptional regulator
MSSSRPGHRRAAREAPPVEERGQQSPARIAVLGLLVERPTHAYDVARRFNQRVGSAWGIRRGQIYQAVYGLEADRLVVREGDDGTGSPTVFRPTARGRAVFESWLASDAADDPRPIRNSLFIRLGFLRPEHVPSLLALVAGREHALLARIREYSEDCPEIDHADGETDLSAVGLHLILGGTLAVLQAELRWLRTVRGTLESLPGEGAREPR